MSLSQSFAAFFLFLAVSFNNGPGRFVHGVGETKFIVGPEPQPLVFGNGAIPQDSMNGGGVPVDTSYWPRPSNPFIDDVNDGRKLYGKKIFRVSDDASSVPAVRKDNMAFSGTRSLAGESCNITNTILSVKFDNSGSIPPDPHGAAGVSRLVAVVNSIVEVRQKNGTLTYQKDFQSFFSGIPGALDTNFFFDPKVIYDEHAGRFVLVALQYRGSPQLSRIWLAVSKNEIPDNVTDWYQGYINSIESIGGGNTWADYPGLEVDEEAVYVTANMFPFSTGSFGVRLWVIRKGIVGGFYGGGALSFNVTNPYAGGGSSQTTMPAQVHGSGGVDRSVGTYLCSLIAYGSGLCELQIITVFNPLSAVPTYTLKTISLGVIDSGLVLPDATQLGTTSTIDSGDNRLYDAVWRNNTLWVVFSIDPSAGVNSGQATAHWVRLRTSGDNFTLEAQGDLGGEGIANQTHTYYPSVAVNRRGLVAYGYAASSPSTYAGAYASVGTSEEVYTVKSGVAPYFRDYGRGRNRWGDYTGISVDPVDDSFWIFNQYADTVGPPNGGTGRWATVWGRLACSPPTKAPTRAPTKAPTKVPTRAPTKAPTRAPTKAPTRAPVPVPSPTQNICGLFGLRFFCPFTLCGLFGRWLGLCRD